MTRVNACAAGTPLFSPVWTSSVSATAATLMLRVLGGSEVTDRDSYMVVRTPDVLVGNFILLGSPPRPGEARLWLSRFSAEFPDPTVVGLRSGDRQCRLSHVNAQHRQSQRGDVKSVLAGPAARIEHRSGESAFGCQPHDCWLRHANVPRRRAVVVRRIPGQSRQPFVAGWVPTTERIVREGS